MTKLDFINEIAKYVVKYANQYGISNHAVPIAQAILESGYGTTDLAQCHNYFGLKTGKNWTGKTITKQTRESINSKEFYVDATFRCYDTMEEGVKGYFEFLQFPRYENLKGIQDNHVFVELLKQDGYATDERYITKILNIIDMYDLSRYNSITEDLFNIVKNTMLGKYGNGEERKHTLGKDYEEVQNIINLTYKTLKGQFGNGKSRKLALGEYYNVVQKLINEEVIK